MDKMTETVTVVREVPQHIQDLVHFARQMGTTQDDPTLLKAAYAFWEQQHGDD